jgi:hypothetical protein
VAQTTQPQQSAGNSILIPATGDSTAPGAQSMMGRRQIGPQSSVQKNLISQSEHPAGDDASLQLASEGTMLLAMANSLKAEVDKSTKDTLSLSVIRKANEIERLAHSMNEKTKGTAGGN